ncbi:MULTISPECIES: endonuclease III [Sphaerochaeta]|jgi:endonuclease-3|uniref:Ultraviolet N-glycosylase/AP lyase n=1 Tax=bioreactor metagenome TaxID=1076179 RepID=A0A644W1P5_9ZZZZ|nr:MULTISPECIES: endonuclease III [Sphaerochaeta]MDT3359840.1 endonuclease III [Spirochaetota bacterium]NLA96878.1 endonuclease III [Spirochaetales bacterium]MDD2396333.1 endonuclease III [Sphaerochaeta sp.]MDD3423845.1 endonuclease III [Sphaerochaeta sp.]MDD3455407.1 endonuclease III [Sphaerochaeta sp.]
MNEQYWDNLFEQFRKAIEAEGQILPSVSIIAEREHDPFRVLIATLISLRTKDEVTLAASQRLFALAGDPHAMACLSEQAIQEAIYPAGFYKTKAKNIRLISLRLIEQYEGRVPDTQHELLALPGVGIKTANLTLNLGYQIDAICVDCHVHQIANRLGWVHTKTPEQTELALQEVMPRRFWIPLNELLVRYGQLICTPVSPFCSKCPQAQRCPKIGVGRSR